MIPPSPRQCRMQYNATALAQESWMGLGCKLLEALNSAMNNYEEIENLLDLSKVSERTNKIRN